MVNVCHLSKKAEVDWSLPRWVQISTFPVNPLFLMSFSFSSYCDVLNTKTTASVFAICATAKDGCSEQ